MRSGKNDWMFGFIGGGVGAAEGASSGLFGKLIGRIGKLLGLSEGAVEEAILGAESGLGATEGFFGGTRCTSKVLAQMARGAGEFHSFPKSVCAFEGAGVVTELGNGCTKLSIPGGYKTAGGPGEPGHWVEGAFTFIKDAAGNINHRFFEA